MSIPFFVLFLFLFHSLQAQENSDLHLFSSVGIYELGAQRIVADTNVRFANTITENGRSLDVYSYINRFVVPCQINGIKFQNLMLFYKSGKLVKMDFIRMYEERVESVLVSRRSDEMNTLHTYLNKRSSVKGRKRIFADYGFMFEQGYQWKKGDKIMQLKIYNRTTSVPKEKMLIFSIRYKDY